MAHEVNKVRRNVMLTPAQDEELNEATKRTGASRSHLMRIALLAYLRHAHEHQPTCADGTHCLCLGRWGRLGTPTRVEADVS